MNALDARVAEIWTASCRERAGKCWESVDTLLASPESDLDDITLVSMLATAWDSLLQDSYYRGPAEAIAERKRGAVKVNRWTVDATVATVAQQEYARIHAMLTYDTTWN